MTGIGKLGQSLSGDCLTGIASDLMAGYQGPAVCWLCSPHPCVCDVDSCWLQPWGLSYHYEVWIILRSNTP